MISILVFGLLPEKNSLFIRKHYETYFFLNVIKISKNKSCVMNTTAGYVIMYIQNDVMMSKNII